MKDKIKRLPSNVTNKIAAGEVVERPASAVKELIENSIDAGSKNIEIRLIEGGKERIQIIDDGCGMSRNDAKISLERFSTSKIEVFEDLEKLVTFGFRGEALASIAAVSIMEIRTRSEEEPEGSILKSEGGSILSIREIPWNRGTSITVGNIFFNTPARRKFQKNALSESRQIYRIFRYFSLAYPELRLSLYNDERCIWNLQPSDLKQRITDVISPGTADKLISIDADNGLYKLYGYISIPDWTRGTRNDQYVFINRRFVKNRTIEHGIFQGYGTTLSQAGRYPLYVLKLETDPDLFDINIHPSKLEARFQDERGLHRFFSEAVYNALCLKGSAPPVYKSTSGKLSERVPEGINPTGMDNFGQSNNVELSLFEKDHHLKQPAIPSPGDQERDVLSGKIMESEKVWQVHNCYIFSQVRSGLVIIDQHVAHERVLYEKALKRLQGNEKLSQQLLFPQTLQLSNDEFIRIRELFSELKKLGFEIKIFSDNTIVIESVPLEVRQGREVETLKNILEEFEKDEYKDLAANERLAASFACRSAVKKGDKLSVDEMYKLIDDLFATEYPYHCPHGRPTIIDFNLKEINSRFLR